MTTETIIEIFCTYKGVPTADIYTRGRDPKRWCTRYMIWHYLHTKMNLSAGHISRMFDRNRPSVFRGIRVINEHMRYHSDVRDEYRAIAKKIEGMAAATPSDMMEEK